MAVVKIVFHSGTGNTRCLAEAVHRGAAAHADAELMEITGSMISDGRFTDEDFLAKLDSADAIIFGSPTYMGMVSGQMKCFFDATSQRWMSGAWNSKLAAGFTTSLGLSGDKQSTLSYLVTVSCQHGMIWVSCDAPNGLFQGASMEEATNRLSSNTGVMSQVNFGPEFHPTPGDERTGELLGERVAKLAARLA
ncbi:MULTISPECIES: flavodoxin family protein [Aphanothece]|uniref:flavodoxin family protein n=1 Tax=Aphanothece TaxID=1121 RepID=UPI003984F0D5